MMIRALLFSSTVAVCWSGCDTRSATVPGGGDAGGADTVASGGETNGTDTVPTGGNAGGTGGMNGDSFGPISRLDECRDRPFGGSGAAGAIACSWDLAKIEFAAPQSDAGDYRAVIRVDDLTFECRTTLPSQACPGPCVETGGGMPPVPVAWRVDSCGPGLTSTRLLGLTVFDYRFRQRPADPLPVNISLTLTRDDRLIGEASWDPVFECFYYGHLGCPRTRGNMRLPLAP